MNANEKLDGRPSGFGHLGLRFERGYAKTTKSSRYYCAIVFYLASFFLTYGFANINPFYLQDRAGKPGTKSHYPMQTILMWISFKGKYLVLLREHGCVLLPSLN